MPGEALVLIEAAAAHADEAALEELVAMLARRNFVRTARRVEGDLVGAVQSACAQDGVGCRLLLEREQVEGRGLRVVVTAKSHAHLALAIVAERSGLFTAEVVGAVTVSGFDLRVDGKDTGRGVDGLRPG